MLGPRVSGGVVVVHRSPEVATQRVALIEADHPIPGKASVDGARALLKQAEDLTERDLAICLFTGGSSALASIPPTGISVADKVKLHRLLLSSGLAVCGSNAGREELAIVQARW